MLEVGTSRLSLMEGREKAAKVSIFATDVESSIEKYTLHTEQKLILFHWKKKNMFFTDKYIILFFPSNR